MGIGSPREGPPSTPDDERELHARLLAGDETAPSDLARAYLGPLTTWLSRAFPREDSHLIESVVIDLISALAKAPARYDPERGSLSGYLRMAARGDMQNALRSEQRRTRRQLPLEDVELSQAAGKLLVGSPRDPADVVADRDTIDPATVGRLRAGFDDVEWEVVQLMGEGERRTSVFARVLGLEALPPAEQERAVKRVKDRLKKRLQRRWPQVRGDD